MLHLFGFAAQHRRLIRDTNGGQMNIRIETLRTGMLELLQELGLVPAIDDVIANVVGLGQREYDQVMASASLRTRGLRFLMPGFAVDDTRDRIFGILLDALPNAHHVAASR